MAFLNEFDHEMRQTRKLLERVPDDRLDFRPHPRSKTLGALAMHAALIPSWTSNLLLEASYDLEPDLASQDKPTPGSRAEILEAFDRSVVKARAHIEAQTPEQLASKWSLLKGEETVVTLPRAAVLRQFLMNHLVHHRGQL